MPIPKSSTPGFITPHPPLRDYFAAKALVGLLSNTHSGEPGVWYDPPASRAAGKTPPPNCCFLPESDAVLWARAAYAMADAMLIETERE